MVEWDTVPFFDHLGLKPEEEADKLVDHAISNSSTKAMEQALAFASEHELNTGRFLTKALRKAVRKGSAKLTRSLLLKGADVKSISPSTPVTTWWLETRSKEKHEAVERMIEVLDVLLDNGWDINDMLSPVYEMAPLIWYVCSSQQLVQYCLQHGASLTISGERTSSNPRDTNADIYITERHYLLLENAACYGDIETFELLKTRGAPLMPGTNWPPWHAPCVLLRAVIQAAKLAPRMQKESKPAYLDRISMVKHLLSTIGLPAHESDPRTWKIVDTDLNPPDEEYSGEDVGENGGQNSRDLMELVALLANAHPHSEALLQLDVDSEDFEAGTTSLDYLRSNMPVPFSKAFKHWQQTMQDRGRPLEDALSFDLKPQAGSASIPLKTDKLSRLPSEVINIIALSLQPKDIRSFRLVSRALRDATFSAFKMTFRCRPLLLSLSLLEWLHENHLFWHVEKVAIDVGAATDIGANAKESKQIKELLTDYFRTSKTKGNLRDLVFYKGRNALLCVLSALKRSELRLRALSMFPEGGHHTISIDCFRGLAGLQDLSTSFSGLEQLTWTLTSSKASKISTSRLNIATIKQIFGMIPMLRKLDLGWFKQNPKKPEVHFLDSCIDEILAMTKLKEIKLRGIFVSLSKLQRLVSETGATRISLIYVTFESEDTSDISAEDSFRNVLDTLTSGRFDYFHLDDLHVSDKRTNVIRFVAPAPTRFPRSPGYRGPMEITRQGNEARRHVEFKIDMGRTLSSGAWQRFQRNRSQIYGSH